MLTKNKTLAGVPKLLPEIVKYYAETIPHVLALMYQNRAVTYHELDQQSAKIAQYLQNQGIRRGDFVALYMPRSLELIISILAIQKAGGAYVPKDIQHSNLVILRTNPPLIKAFWICVSMERASTTPVAKRTKSSRKPQTGKAKPSMENPTLRARHICTNGRSISSRARIKPVALSGNPCGKPAPTPAGALETCGPRCV
ncbi:MAG: AMP-binding protein [Bacteroidota bacterium]